MEIKKFNLNSVQQLLMVGFNPSQSIDSWVFLIKSLNGGFMSCWFVITVRERPCEITAALPAPAAVKTDLFEMVEFVIRCYWAEPISDETWLSFSVSPHIMKTSHWVRVCEQNQINSQSWFLFDLVWPGDECRWEEVKKLDWLNSENCETLPNTNTSWCCMLPAIRDWENWRLWVTPLKQSSTNILFYKIIIWWIELFMI